MLPELAERKHVYPLLSAAELKRRDPFPNAGWHTTANFLAALVVLWSLRFLFREHSVLTFLLVYEVSLFAVYLLSQSRRPWARPATFIACGVAGCLSLLGLALAWTMSP